ncbi:MAG: DUF4390 domain-containing protein [Deltaproteobacteria bacterium]|nr:DUF4390 domain-containing protein [Deltaproteobacteria bacterium]
MKKLFFYTALICALIFVPVENSFAASAKIVNAALDATSGLSFTMNVEGAMTKDMEKAIMSGMPTKFTFLVEVYKIKPLWPDAKVGSWKFHHIVKYDVLKEEFEVRLGESNTVIKTKDRGEMVALMTGCKNVSISPMPILEPGKRYKFRIKAMLDEITLPFYLDYLFFFIKLWEFETPWYAIEFVHGQK